MKLFEYKANKPRKPLKNLVIFLHGYNDCVENHTAVFESLRTLLPHSYVVMPQSDEVCEKNPAQFQWFGMQKYDPKDLRTKPEIDSRQINAIYCQTAPKIDAKAKQINGFIDELQQKYGIDNAHTYLIGFSQGAMLTLYSALSRHTQIGGAFAIAGLIAGRKLLAKKISSLPPIYLFHGRDDLKVQFKTIHSTVFWLKRHGLPTKVFTYAGLTHHVTKQEIAEICAVINNN